MGKTVFVAGSPGILTASHFPHTGNCRKQAFCTLPFNRSILRDHELQTCGMGTGASKFDAKIRFYHWNAQIHRALWVWIIIVKTEI